jgi:hypothetical protein
MDFLDPLYNRRHTIRLYTIYGLVALAIFLAVTLLLLIAYGFQLSKNGEVIQNGLLFASSKPVGATLYIDGATVDKQTNTRLNIPEGSYELELKRDGYRSWQHHITIIGGRVFRYDYPLLFPETLQSTTTKILSKTAPGIVTQTPDHRRLLVQQVPSVPTFVMFDVKNPKSAPPTLTIPAAAYTAGGKQSWHVVEWAKDNVHVLLRHGYGKSSTEYVLFNRETPAESVNLSDLFKVPLTRLSMIDEKFDRYYLYSSVDKVLRSASLDQPTPQIVLKDVLEYEPYKADTILYVTSISDDKTQVEVRLQIAGRDYTLRRLSTAKSYHLAVSKYSGDTYVALADPSKQLVQIYRNPLTRLSAQLTAVPTVSFKFATPSFLEFSASGRFILAERGTDFITYDAEYKRSASYQTTQSIDKGQNHAAWLDGAHLQYVSNQQLYVFDYDGSNPQLLVPTTVGATGFYDNNYSIVYTVAPPSAASNQRYVLMSTSLRTPADQ